MQPFLEVLFALTRQRFDVEHAGLVDRLASTLPPGDWERLATIAAQDGVAPIVAVNLSECRKRGARIPGPVLARLNAALVENVALKMQRRAQVVAGLVELDAAGYDALLLKSAALETRVYRHPWVTAARDADMILRVREEWLHSQERSVRRALYTNGVECDRFDHHDVTMHDVVRVSFQDVWRDARQVQVDGAPAYVSCAEDHLVLLCLNACRKRFLRLKPLFDIAETIAAERIDWTRVRARTQQARCGPIVFTALYVTQRTLGLPADVPIAMFAGRTRRATLRTAVAAVLQLQRHAWQTGQKGQLALRAAASSLQYLGFSMPQIARSLRASTFHRLPQRANAGVEAALPGESPTTPLPIAADIR